MGKPEYHKDDNVCTYLYNAHGIKLEVGWLGQHCSLEIRLFYDLYSWMIYVEGTCDTTLYAVHSAKFSCKVHAVLAAPPRHVITCTPTCRICARMV